MNITGESEINVPPSVVWEALNDAEILRQSIPGCETLDKVSDTEFTAKVTTKIGPIKAKFSGEVELADLDPPNGYTLSGRGSGGAAGKARGSARITLEAIPEGTRLSYDVTADVSGKIAQLGARLLKGTATSLAEKFFANFNAIVAGEADAAE